MSYTDLRGRPPSFEEGTRLLRTLTDAASFVRSICIVECAAPSAEYLEESSSHNGVICSSPIVANSFEALGLE